MQKRLFCFYILILFFSASMQAAFLKEEQQQIINDNDYEVYSVEYRFREEWTHVKSVLVPVWVKKGSDRVQQELKSLEKAQELFDVKTKITIKKKNNNQYSVVKPGFYDLHYSEDGDKAYLYDYKYAFSSCKSETVSAFSINLRNDQEDRENFWYPMNQKNAKIEEVTLNLTTFEPTGNSAVSTIKLPEQPKQKFNNKTIFGIPLLGILGLVVYKLFNKNSSTGLSAS